MLPNPRPAPAVYLFVGTSLNATPSQLGTLTLCRALVQTLASPLSGVLGDRWAGGPRVRPAPGVQSEYRIQNPRAPAKIPHHAYSVPPMPPRTRRDPRPLAAPPPPTHLAPAYPRLLHPGRCDRRLVLSSGAFIWGAMTSAIALSRSLREAMAFAAVNGLGLALLVPCCQSLVADLHPPERRGRAFGLMQLTGALGGLAGSVFATNMGASQALAAAGWEGWRVAFHIVAAVSVLTGEGRGGGGGAV